MFCVVLQGVGFSLSVLLCFMQGKHKLLPCTCCCVCNATEERINYLI